MAWSSWNFQTLFFAVAPFKIKEKSNNAHTFPGQQAPPLTLKLLLIDKYRNRFAKARKAWSHYIDVIWVGHKLDQWE
jgi:hypothetical protein